MSFASFPFVAFLAASVILYYIIPKRAQWVFLLIISTVFYAASGVFNIPFLLLAVLLSYLFARKIGKMADAERLFIENNRETMDKDARKAYKAAQKKRRFGVLIVSVILLIGLMLADKIFETYILGGLPVSADVRELLLQINYPLTRNGAGNALLSVLGISYFVFMSVGYLIDVYREKVQPQNNFFKYALFVSFFPQTVQGPISRYGDLEAQLYTPHVAEWSNISGGLLRVLWGYFKKLVIADSLAPVIGTLTDGEHKGVYVIFAIVLYTAQIYGDFTGGIDITIGTAEMLGITLKENFRHPFRSTSLKEYWNRWHITMGSWFTDYVFYPLSVSKPMQRLSKFSREKLGQGVGKRLPVYIATVVTWLATGVWHGTKWNFIVWGLLNCLVILVSQECEPLYKKFREKFPRMKKSTPWFVFSAVRTFFIVGTLRLLDIYPSVGSAFEHVGSIFTTFNARDAFGNITNLGIDGATVICVAVAVLIVFVVTTATAHTDLKSKIISKPGAFACVALLLVCTVLIFGAYGMGYDASQFIYGGAKFK